MHAKKSVPSIIQIVATQLQQLASYDSALLNLCLKQTAKFLIASVGSIDSMGLATTPSWLSFSSLIFPCFAFEKVAVMTQLVNMVCCLVLLALLTTHRVFGGFWTSTGEPRAGIQDGGDSFLLWAEFSLFCKHSCLWRHFLPTRVLY